MVIDWSSDVCSSDLFVDIPSARPEIWAYGFRNPWRLAFDRTNGNLWVGQNGQDLWEQVYLVHRGENYGWSVYEGSHPFNLNRKRRSGERRVGKEWSLTGVQTCALPICLSTFPARGRKSGLTGFATLGDWRLTGRTATCGSGRTDRTCGSRSTSFIAARTTAGACTRGAIRLT